MEAPINTVSHASCNARYGIVVDDYTICAGDLKGICQGDSGGPLARLGSSAASDVQMGITSFSPAQGCGVKGWPNGFTRVSYYVPWIESIVCTYSKRQPAWCKATTAPTKKPTRKPTRKPAMKSTKKLTKKPKKKPTRFTP